MVNHIAVVEAREETSFGMPRTQQISIRKGNNVTKKAIFSIRSKKHTQVEFQFVGITSSWGKLADAIHS
jgi:hypothetical protein